MRHRPIVHLAALACLAIAPASSFASVKFVALPDTQIYSEDRLPGSPGGPPVTDPLGTYRYFVDQVQWIADNAESLGIDYVIHLGDIIDNDDVPVEWVRAKAALDVLDEAGIPYGTVIGNHDAHNRSSGRPYWETYVANFGPQYFEDRPWFGGASPTGASNFQIIGDDGDEVLFLNLSIAAPAVELAWADGVLLAHRDKPVVLTTHAWMYDVFASYGRYGEPIAGGLGSVAGDGSFPNIHGGAGKTAQEIYLEFIQSHPNVVMAQGGHFDADLYRLDGRNGSGLPVLEIVSDYQSLRNGGDGYLRIYEFDFETGRIDVETYSPTLDRQRTTFEHFVNAVWLMYEFRDEVADALGVTDAQAFAILAALFKVDSVPGVDVVGQHPDYLAEPGYYEQLFVDQFAGAVPPEVGTLPQWEGLWTSYFAPPGQPTDYGPSIRSPAFSVPMDFERYVSGDRDVTPAEAACIVAMASQAGTKRGLLARQNTHNERCLRDEGRGRLVRTVDQCLEDTRGTAVERAAARTFRTEEARCDGDRPDFGVTNATAVNQVATSESRSMTADLFGPAPIFVASSRSNRSAYRCQIDVSRRTNALLESMLRAALDEASQSLAGGTQNAADLTVGMLGTIDGDPEGKIARFRDALRKRIERHCDDEAVDADLHLPGCAGAGLEPDALAGCIETRARCRACRTLNGVHGSSVSCDFFDDGESLNQSCP